ncbi:MAG: site-2 protease family protein [Chloroflexi bacterium]|nr:site-2 protease family protein [Chloroflexota bacterium]
MSLEWIPSDDRVLRLEDDLAGVFNIHSVTDRGPGQALVFAGEFLRSPDLVYAQIGERFKARGYMALLRRERGQDLVVALPAPAVAGRSRPWLHPLLFVLTVLSTWMSGTLQWVFGNADRLGIAPDANLSLGATWQLMLANWTHGLPFAVALLGILGVHEFGHYFVARHYKLDVSLPYFIPFPLNYLTGTLGAVIRIQSPFQSRKALFDVGIAGPLAGLAVAIPVLALGMSQAQVVAIAPGQGGMSFGEPLLFQWMARLIVGARPPGTDIVMNPLLMAGWWGLLITALNLFPVSQLDGGHIAYALFGRWHRVLARGMFLAAVLVAILRSPSYAVMMVLVLMMGLDHPPALDDLTPVGTPRRILGSLTLIAFFLLFTPVPLAQF